MTEIQNRLFALQDRKYRDFQSKLIPTVSPETVIGVRTPALRALAKELKREAPDLVTDFLGDLPHAYFDENQLHAFLISLEKDAGRCIADVNAFLPYVDNWATCDQLSPKVFKKHKAELLEQIGVWMASDHAYTVRFGIGMLMQWFLDEDFAPDFPERVADVRFENGDETDEYYVNMMRAWYFATALAKQYDAVLPMIEAHRLDPWTHNKAIQKARESYRVPEERKAYLNTLKVK